MPSSCHMFLCLHCALQWCCGSFSQQSESLLGPLLQSNLVLSPGVLKPIVSPLFSPAVLVCYCQQSLVGSRTMWLSVFETCTLTLGIMHINFWESRAPRVSLTLDHCLWGDKRVDFRYSNFPSWLQLELVASSEISVTKILFPLGCYSSKKNKFSRLFVIKQELIWYLLIPGNSISNEHQESLVQCSLFRLRCSEHFWDHSVALMLHYNLSHNWSQLP